MENETKPTCSQYLQIGARAFMEGFMDGLRMVGIGLIKVVQSPAYAFLGVAICFMNLLILIDMLYHACVGCGLPPTWQVVLAAINSLFLVYWVPTLIKQVRNNWRKRKEELQDG